MKYTLGILLFISSFGKVNAQDTLVQKFINSIYKQVIDSNAKYYYLLETGIMPGTGFSNKEIDFSSNELSRYNVPPGIPFDDFKASLKTDTTPISWRNYTLTDARVVTEKQLPSGYCMAIIYKYMPYNTPDSLVRVLENNCTIPVLVKKGLTKKQLENAKIAARKRYDDRPLEEQRPYIFSKPVFSKDKNYALIGIGDWSGGGLYFFKRTATGWAKIMTFDRYEY
jgi:hypothetical protein